jgi:hypothetical protein
MCGFLSRHESSNPWDRHPEAVASARKVEARVVDEGETLPGAATQGTLGPLFWTSDMV